MKEFSLLFPNWSKLQKHLNSDCSPDSAGRGAEWSSFPFNHLCSTTNRKQQQQWTSSLLLPLMDPEPLQTRGLQTGTGHHSTAVFVHSSQSDQSSSGWAANSSDVFASTGRLRAERSERLNLSRDAGLLPKGCQNQTSTRLRLCLTSSHKGGPFLPVLTAWSRGVLTFFLFFFLVAVFPQLSSRWQWRAARRSPAFGQRVGGGEREQKMQLCLAPAEEEEDEEWQRGGGRASFPVSAEVGWGEQCVYGGQLGLRRVGMWKTAAGLGQDANRVWWPCRAKGWGGEAVRRKVWSLQQAAGLTFSIQCAPAQEINTAEILAKVFSP